MLPRVMEKDQWHEMGESIGRLEQWREGLLNHTFTYS